MEESLKRISSLWPAPEAASGLKSGRPDFPISGVKHFDKANNSGPKVGAEIGR
jgi:hypothetical protein